jgi:very-short-patch-repair endonuclease
VCAPRKKLVIELDGSQHLDQEQYDKERTNFLLANGFRVIRFWNNDVMNHIEDVMQSIQRALDGGKDEATSYGLLEK